jgi:hypothetical protein
MPSYCVINDDDGIIIPIDEDEGVDEAENSMSMAAKFESIKNTIDQRTPVKDEQILNP